MCALMSISKLCCTSDFHFFELDTSWQLLHITNIEIEIEIRMAFFFNLFLQKMF